MIIDYKSRQSGKTTLVLLIMIQKPNLYLVVCNQKYCEDLKFRYPVIANRIIIFINYINGSLIGHNKTEVYIDDLDLCLQQISPVPIIGISLTIEKKRFLYKGK